VVVVAVVVMVVVVVAVAVVVAVTVVVAVVGVVMFESQLRLSLRSSLLLVCCCCRRCACGYCHAWHVILFLSRVVLILPTVCE